MQVELYAYLFNLGTQGHWVRTTFTHAENLLRAAQDALQAEGSSALVHLGFWCPSVTQVSELVKSAGPGLIVSDAAAGAFADWLPVDAAAVGCVRGVVFRRVSMNWTAAHRRELSGQEVQPAVSCEAKATSAESVTTPVLRRVPDNWVDELAIKGSEELAKAVLSAGIVNENSYLEFEARLAGDLRLELGIFRFNCLSVDQLNAPGILDNLSACPPWLLNVPLDSLDLSVRQINVFRAKGLKQVADLLSLGNSGLLKLPNFGLGSAKILGEALMRALESGQGLLAAAPDGDSRPSAFTAYTEAETGRESFLSGLHAISSMLNDMQKEVWQGRLGLSRDAMTLSELGARLQVSRERIRQIEAQIYRLVARHPFLELLAAHLDSALDGRQTALMLQDLPDIDPWFASDTPLERPLSALLENLLPNRFGVYVVEEKQAVSQLPVEGWRQAHAAARGLLEEAAKEQSLEADVRSKCDQLLAGQGQELRDALWNEVTSSCLWANRPGEPRRLVSLGDGIRAVILTVLESAEAPLHFAEIHRRMELIRPGHDLRYVQNVVHEIGVLFERGTYGLPRHCPLGREALLQVRLEVETLMMAGDEFRQWHSSELCQALIEHGLGFEGQLTPYIVNFALRDSDWLVDLRRMVWGLATAWQEGAASRVAVRDAVIALLQEHGRPMSTDEIRERLSETRGVGQIFQIHPSGPLVRIGTGIWGLASGFGTENNAM